MDTTTIELAERHSDGVEVRLLWNRATNQVTLEVTDDRTEATYEVLVAGELAMDAFRHPFVYVQRDEPAYAAVA